MSDREEYYAAAKSWSEGQASGAARETRIAWRVAAGAGIIALLLALALAFLVPLKTVQPYVLTVDRQTGAVEPALTVQSGRLSQNEAVIQAQLAGYVIARETFDATDLSQKYRRVQIMSARPVAAAYVADGGKQPRKPAALAQSRRHGVDQYPQRVVDQRWRRASPLHRDTQRGWGRDRTPGQFRLGDQFWLQRAAAAPVGPL